MNDKGKDAPVIIAGTGILQGQKWNITSDIYIGRDQGCEIMIDSRQVSRQHAKIFYKKEGFFIQDLQSKNGTIMDHIQLKEEPLPLQDGAKIQIALTQEFTFFLSDATVALNISETPESDQPQPQSKTGLYIDHRARRVVVKGEEILPPLSKAQYTLLSLLIENENDMVSREKCIKAIWGEEGAYEVSNQALDALIRRLRVRIAENDPDFDYIVTVRGHGLRFENQNAD